MVLIWSQAQSESRNSSFLDSGISLVGVFEIYLGNTVVGKKCNKIYRSIIEDERPLGKIITWLTTPKLTGPREVMVFGEGRFDIGSRPSVVMGLNTGKKNSNLMA